MTGPPPLDRRVTEVEKNLGQLVDLVGTLTTGVQALQAKVDGKPAKKEPGPSRWAWEHVTAVVAPKSARTDTPSPAGGE